MNRFAHILPAIPGSVMLSGNQALKNRCTAAAAVGIPALAALAAPFLLWTGVLHFNWIDFGIFAFMYTVSGLGVTVGLHRLFTHRSFEAKPALQATLGAMGIMALQGNITGWAATHRRHHRYSDQHGDPHMPIGKDLEGYGTFRSLFYVHFSRLFMAEDTLPSVYAPDLLQNSLVQKVDRLTLLWVFLTIAIPATASWALKGGLQGAIEGAYWGGLVRIFVGHNVGSCVNSLCHMFGSTPFKTADQSKNNTFVGLAAFGEGWHNNHHAFPASAKQGLFWWQLDLSYAFISACEKLGLASQVKVPSPQMIAEKKSRSVS